MTSYYYLQLLQAACEEGLAEALGTQRVYFFAVAINAIPVEQRVESVRIPQRLIINRDGSQTSRDPRLVLLPQLFALLLAALVSSEMVRNALLLLDHIVHSIV